MRNFGQKMWRRVGDYERIQVPLILQSYNDKINILKKSIERNAFLKQKQRQEKEFLEPSLEPNMMSNMLSNIDKDNNIIVTIMEPSLEPSLEPTMLSNIDKDNNNIVTIMEPSLEPSLEPILEPSIIPKKNRKKNKNKKIIC
jgi:hypothetical protein